MVVRLKRKVYFKALLNRDTDIVLCKSVFVHAVTEDVYACSLQ